MATDLLVCSIDTCNKPHLARGWCNTHYRRWHRYNDPLKVNKISQGPEVCIILHCNRSGQIVKGLCNRHYHNLRRFGDPLINNKREYRKRGSGGIDKDGYVRVSINGVRKAEHRWIMEDILGRELLDSEQIHHKNGVRSDNRPENLELWIKPQPTGGRVQDIIAWAHELIERYEDIEKGWLS